MQVPQASINAVALTADANLLFIGDSDGCVKVFRRKVKNRCAGHSQWILSTLAPCWTNA